MSLSTLVNYTDVAQWRVYGQSATPESFRLIQSPLDADLLLQAPKFVGQTSSPKRLSVAQVGSLFH